MSNFDSISGIDKLSGKPFTNELIHESSPYLRSHAHNPVNWLAWGEKAIEKARLENKLIIISIGYSACHWCHVMERESFEDREVADLMNNFFISIKVDREERPDIDQIYLEAVQLMTGHGGWPLHCIIMPTGEPIYGGTYFRKEDWKNILVNLAGSWKSNPSEAYEYGRRLISAMKERKTLSYTNPLISKDKSFFEGSENAHNLNEIISQLQKSWIPNLDPDHGGFIGYPKFPLPNSWCFLMELNQANLDSDQSLEIVEFLKVTFRDMSFGGLYDHLRGGFARYSTDEYWFAPHFEKMLYDNAQLISLYAEAYLLEQNKEEKLSYKKVITETIKFLNHDLAWAMPVTEDQSGSNSMPIPLNDLSPEHNFRAYYSALDADSEGIEGKYYVWSKAELVALLGSSEPIFSTYFSVRLEGNWEGQNILYRRPNQELLYTKLGLTKASFLQEIEHCKNTLLIHRYTRIKPNLDDKILCSWNALMISGLCNAYKALEEDIYLEMALSTARFLIKYHLSHSIIYRIFRDESTKVPGFLDDYAFLAEALVQLYQSTFDVQWLMEAKNILNLIQKNFLDENSSLFYYTSREDKPLIIRTKEIQDSVIPSSNSVLAQVFFTMGHYFYNDFYQEQSRKMVEEMGDRLINQSTSYANWGRLFLKMVKGPVEICIVGSKAESFRKEIEKSYIPFKIISGWIPKEEAYPLFQNRNQEILPVLEDKIPDDNTSSMKTLIYLCRNRACDIPYESVSEAIQHIKNLK